MTKKTLKKVNETNLINLPKNLNPIDLALSSSNPTTAFNALKNCIEIVYQYKTIKLENECRREEIRLAAQKAIHQINAKKEILLEFIHETFSERRKVLEDSFRLLDQAIENNNQALIDKSLTMILNVVQTSPFRNFEDFCNKMRNDDEIIEL